MKAKKQTATALQAWLAAEPATPADDDAPTMEELADAWNVSTCTARERMRRYIKAGKVKIGKRTMTRFNGAPYPVRTFRLLPE